MLYNTMLLIPSSQIYWWAMQTMKPSFQVFGFVGQLDSSEETQGMGKQKFIFLGELTSSWWMFLAETWGIAFVVKQCWGKLVWLHEQPKDRCCSLRVTSIGLPLRLFAKALFYFLLQLVARKNTINSSKMFAMLFKTCSGLKCVQFDLGLSLV